MLFELEKRCRPQLKSTDDSWRVDKTYIKVKAGWKYLLRAVDSAGQTIDFILSAKQNKRAAKRFFQKTFPEIINEHLIKRHIALERSTQPWRAH